MFTVAHPPVKTVWEFILVTIICQGKPKLNPNLATFKLFATALYPRLINHPFHPNKTIADDDLIFQQICFQTKILLER